MAHIPVPDGAPGIRGLMMTHPEQTRPMNEIANALLHADSTLTQGEREIIGAYVSNGNHCKYCATVHTAIAAHQMSGDYSIVHAVLQDPSTAPITPKLKALLAIADKVREGGLNVTAEHVDAARREGATDVEIHDTVLIAASFCMFNRYVDGLATWAPDDLDVYDAIGRQRAVEGYLTGYKTISKLSQGTE